MSEFNKKRSKWPTILAVMGVLLLIAGGVFWKSRAGKRAAFDPSLLTKVTRGDLEVAVTELGKIEPREKVAVKSKVAGQVEKILIEEGMPVKSGQLLLFLDPTEFQRSVVRAQQEVDKAQASLDFARVTLDRRRRAFADRAVAQADVDLAENDWKTKKIAVAQAREALAVADDQLRYSRIIAPIDGTVIQRSIRVGETVVPGTMATLDEKSLMVVADMSTLIAKVELNQIDVAKVRLDQDVTLTLDALPGKNYHAKVSKIAPAAITPKGKETDIFPVEATLDAGALADIKPGMTADVKFHIDVRKGVLKLPIEAVTKEDGKHFVSKLVEKQPGQAKVADKIEVKVGVRNDREQEIVSGVAESDEVVIRPPSAAANEFK
ncbi:MAG TPA: efflux RND transporter periplasmic adaptor subunit [Pseudomonadota bacterium]|jgi:HlyD family secretion protein/macrolide-specific efflux system membrane fusion protein|nr:efflux RND transporter periplasmic adaptor subunit [Pseudomonadota bacterium]HNO69778.1 efflux RND transporter periplasmic adaptor subunit [Pseudomonadota bacterium]